MDRNFKGIWIPKEIWLSENLTILEKILLVEIDSLEDEEKGCFASNKYFSNFFKLTNGRISQIINDLNKKKYISIDYQYKGKEIEKRILRINRPPYPEVFNKLNRYLENDDGGIKFSKEGYLENAKDNNIYTNNIIDNKKKNIQKEKYGEFKNVLLTEEEYEKIKDKNMEQFIDKLSIYIESKGNKYKSHYATILNWSRKEKEQKDNRPKTSREKMDEVFERFLNAKDEDEE